MVLVFLHSCCQASPKDAEGDGDDAALGRADDDRVRPQTRKDLDVLKGNFSNKLVMAFHYHQDPLLPLEFKAMFLAARPLLHEYEDTLEEHRLGQVTRL